MPSHKNEYMIPGCYLLPLTVLTVILFLTAVCLNNCYFWDNIRQTSVEAHWFLEKGTAGLFSPDSQGDSTLARTGYHPPLIGITTALLWKVFGYNLAVSHVFIGLWAAGLLFFVYRIACKLLQPEVAGMATAVIMLDSTVLSQIAIASPDIVMLTCFTAAMWAILEKRITALAVFMAIIVMVNGRGIILASAIMLFVLVISCGPSGPESMRKKLMSMAYPFIPAFVLLAVYYIFLNIRNSWIWPAHSTEWAEGWQRPENIGQVLKNIAAFGLRIAENGRIAIFITAFAILLKRKYSGMKLFFREKINRALTAALVLLLVAFFLFALSTKLVITSRYYMSIMLLLTLLLYRMTDGILRLPTLRLLTVAIIAVLITGNMWIYPERTAKAWDGTLAHLPFYKVREECLLWLREQGYETKEVSAGFCIKGKQQYIDLKEGGMSVGERHDGPYFLYSNISNVDDRFVDELYDKEKWTVVKEFKKAWIFIRLYENNLYMNHEENTDSGSDCSLP